MKFSIAAFAVTVVFVVISGFVSFKEGTLTSRRVTIGFINHGGMWGDCLILSVVNGLVWPYLPKGLPHIVLAAIPALSFTLWAHRQWGHLRQKEGTTCHMFPGYYRWHGRLSFAGWLHVAYMSAQVAVLLMYLVAAVPSATIWTASSLATVHVFLGTVQPGWYVSGATWTKGNFLPPLCATGIIWLIGICKIYSA